MTNPSPAILSHTNNFFFNPILFPFISPNPFLLNPSLPSNQFSHIFPLDSSMYHPLSSFIILCYPLHPIFSIFLSRAFSTFLLISPFNQFPPCSSIFPNQQVLSSPVFCLFSPVFILSRSVLTNPFFPTPYFLIIPFHSSNSSTDMM